MAKFLDSVKNFAPVPKLINYGTRQKISMLFWFLITILQGGSISPLKDFNGLDDSYSWLISQSARNLSIIKGEQFLTMGQLGFLDLADPTWHVGYSLSVVFKVTTTTILWLSINQTLKPIYQSHNSKYLTATLLTTFFSLINPTSINLIIGMFLYSHKNKKNQTISWIILLYVLFFVKLLPFVLAILFLGLRKDLRQHLKTIIVIDIFLYTVSALIVGFENFSNMMLGSYEVFKGYANMNTDNLAYWNHYVYFFLFSTILIIKVFRKYNNLQRISLILILNVIFKYGFVRHDVFHTVVTFSIITAIGLHILSDDSKNKLCFGIHHKVVRISLLVTLYLFIFYSIHAQKILPLSKFNYLIILSILFYSILNIKKLLFYNFFKYFSTFLIATFAISGITHLNPIMPTVIKSNPISLIERAEWTFDSIFAILTNNYFLLENKYVKTDKSAKLTEFTKLNNLDGNFFQISYTVPLNFSYNPNLKELFPPSNPTSTFTDKLDQANVDWLTHHQVDWIFFDGKSIGSRQLLNDSPNFFRIILCNYDIFSYVGDHLILKKIEVDKCGTFKNKILTFIGESDIKINSSDFVYLVDKENVSILSDLINVLWKPTHNLNINNNAVFLKSNSNGTLVHIPKELDFPGKFSLNGNIDSTLALRFKDPFFISD